MTNADLWEKRMEWLDRLRAAPLTSERCGELAALPRLQIVSAASVLRNPVTGPDWLATGDAAMAFDPLSGQGVFRGLDSGLRAVSAIERMFDGVQAVSRNSSCGQKRLSSTIYKYERSSTRACADGRRRSSGSGAGVAEQSRGAPN